MNDKDKAAKVQEDLDAMLAAQKSDAAEAAAPEDAPAKDPADDYDDEDETPAPKAKKAEEPADEEGTDPEDDDEDEADAEAADPADDSASKEGEDDEEDDSMVPKWQVKAALRKQRKQLAKEAAGLDEEDLEDPDSEGVAALVKKHGLDPEQGPAFVRDIAKYVAAKAVPKALMERLSKYEQAAADAAEQQGFEREFASSEPAIAKMFPAATPRDVAAIKRKVRELAYTEKYAKYAVEDIIRLNRGALRPAARATVDASRPGASRSQAKYDLDNPDSIPWGEMSPDEFGKVSDALAARAKAGRKAQIVRTGGTR